MIDAHILLGDDPIDWLMDCLADISAFPVQLYPCSAVAGNVSAARKKGWSQGRLPYLTWFDPDDRYPPCADDFLREAEEILDSRTDLECIYSVEQRVNEHLEPICEPDTAPFCAEKSLSSPSFIHGLIVLRRTSVMRHVGKLNDSMRYPEWELFKQIAKESPHGFFRLPYVARLWRQHKDQASRQK